MDKFTITTQSAIMGKKANGHLGWIEKSVTSSPREVLLSLYCALERTYLEYWSRSGLPSFTETGNCCTGSSGGYTAAEGPGEYL